MKIQDGRRFGLVTGMFAVILVAGCASSGGVPQQSTNVDVTLVVENHNWLDAKIYALRSGTRIRLGTVTSMRTGRFVVPPMARAPGHVRLRVELLGSNEAHTTDEILVQPGNHVYWSIENYLPLSSYSVR